MRNVLTDTNVYMRTKRKILGACVRSRLTYATQAVIPNEKQLKKLDACWYRLLRNKIRGGWVREKSQAESDEESYSCVYTRKLKKLYKQCQSETTYSHNIHCSHLQMSQYGYHKKMLFAKPTSRYNRDDLLKIGELLGVTPEQGKRTTQARGEFAELVHHRFSSTP